MHVCTVTGFLRCHLLVAFEYDRSWILVLGKDHSYIHTYIHRLSPRWREYVCMCIEVTSALQVVVYVVEERQRLPLAGEGSAPLLNQTQRLGHNQRGSAEVRVQVKR